MKEPMLIWITLPGTTAWHKTNDFNYIALSLLTHPDAEILVTVFTRSLASTRSTLQHP